MFVTTSEIKKITIDGLNIVSHQKELSQFFSKGWTPYLVSPNIKHMKMEYQLKRFIDNSSDKQSGPDTEADLPFII